MRRAHAHRRRLDAAAVDAPCTDDRGACAGTDSGAAAGAPVYPGAEPDADPGLCIRSRQPNFQTLRDLIHHSMPCFVNQQSWLGFPHGSHKGAVSVDDEDNIDGSGCGSCHGILRSWQSHVVCL